MFPNYVATVLGTVFKHAFKIVALRHIFYLLYINEIVHHLIHSFTFDSSIYFWTLQHDNNVKA